MSVWPMHSIHCRCTCFCALSVCAFKFSPESPADFTGGPIEVVFNIGDSRVCYTISIVDDDVCEEPSENFLSQLLGSQVEFVFQVTEVVIGDVTEPECGKIDTAGLRDLHLV